MVVVDGTSSIEHEPGRWIDPQTSPLFLADRGRLLVVDCASLPLEVQQLLARADAERRCPWESAVPLDVSLVLTATTPRSELEANGLLDPVLAARLAGGVSVSLPRLRERPEDLRALVSDRLAREGLRARGAPVGIDDAAFARLLDHPFDGEDAELASLVQRLVAGCEGNVIRVRQVDALLAAEPDVVPAARARASGV